MAGESELGIARVPIRATLDDLDKDLASARGKIDKALSDVAAKAGKGLEKLGKAAILGGIGAITAAVVGLSYALYKAVGASTAEQQGIAQLRAAVVASGGDWDTATAAIERYLKVELERTALDDGQGRAAIARLTEITGDYRAALALMGLTQDVAIAKDMDLVAAAELVGRVQQGNTGILKRHGIQVEEDTSAIEALGLMQQKYAGQAEAYGQSLAGQAAQMQVHLGNISEGVGGIFEKGLTKLVAGANTMLGIVEVAIEKVGPLFSVEFENIADTMLGAGENIGANLAQGIANAIPYLLATLRIIGDIISFWLEPGSPPRLLPGLQDWGTEAMNAWFQGWTKGDFDILKGITGELRSVMQGLVGEGVIGAGEANPLVRAVRAQIAAALDELRATGGISEETFGGIRAAGGQAGAAAEALARRHLGVEQARLKVQDIEARLMQATTGEQVDALAEELAAAQEEQRQAQEALALEQERLGALTDESSLMERQAAAMESVAAATERAGKAAADLAALLAMAPKMPELPTESPFAKMFNVEEIERKTEEIRKSIWVKLMGEDGESGPLPRLKRFMEGDFKYVVLGVLAAIAIGAILAFGSWVLAAAPVLLAIAGISLAVALLKKAWDEDWMGMRTTLEAAWEKIRPILEKLAGKLSDIIAKFEEAMKKQREWREQGGKPIPGTGGQYVYPPGYGQGGGAYAGGLEPTWFRRPTSLLVGEAGAELVSVVPRSQVGQGGGKTVNYSQTLNVQDRGLAALLAIERDRWLRGVVEEW